MTWELKSDRPLYTQLIEQLRRFIISGVYAPGARLPSVRELAAEASVNPNTMQKALAELERSGLISTSRNNGRFVTENKQQIEETRLKLAQDIIAEFLNQMGQLGYDRQETLGLLEKTPQRSAEVLL